MTSIYILERNNIPFYVGKTNSNIKNRRIYLHKAKFGKDIHLEFIDEVSIVEWKFWESYYISLFKFWGFKLENKNNGGGGLTNVKQETKNKISKTIRKNKTRGPKISKANKGMSKSHKGKKLTQEHKDNIKNTRGFLKERKNTWSKDNIKPIEQYDLDGNFIKEFKSLKEANKKLKITNIKNSQIGRCANGYNKTSYGYIWKWKNK